MGFEPEEGGELAREVCGESVEYRIARRHRGRRKVSQDSGCPGA